MSQSSFEEDGVVKEIIIEDQSFSSLPVIGYPAGEKVELTEFLPFRLYGATSDNNRSQWFAAVNGNTGDFGIYDQNNITNINSDNSVDTTDMRPTNPGCVWGVYQMDSGIGHYMDGALYLLKGNMSTQPVGAWTFNPELTLNGEQVFDGSAIKINTTTTFGTAALANNNDVGQVIFESGTQAVFQNGSKIVCGDNVTITGLKITFG